MITTIKFLATDVAPRPEEVDYWVDISDNPYKGTIKYFNGSEWVRLQDLSGDLDLTKYYTRNEINNLLNDKASVGSVESKLDDSEASGLIKNVNADSTINELKLVSTKYDGSTVVLNIPIADNGHTGVITSSKYKDLVTQSDKQALYTELYSVAEGIRQAYQRRLIAGKNIKIEDNVINASGDISVEWDKILNKPLLKEVAISGDYNDLVNKLTPGKDVFISNDNVITINIDSDTLNTELNKKADKITTYTKEQVDQKITSVYRIKGSILFENLPTINNIIGDTYNITNSFDLDSKHYDPGTNIVYTDTGWDALSGSFDTTTIENSISTIDTKIDQEIIRATSVEDTITANLSNEISRATTAENTKVDKVAGKQLSANDYTTIEKTKLAGIETNANNYVLTKTKVETVLTGDILSHTHGQYLTTHQDISGKADKATTLSGYGITDAATISSLNAHTNNTDIHIPTGAIAGQILKANSSGKATWVDDQLESLKNLTELMSYGVEWDVTQSTPDCVRVGNSLLHKSLPIQNGLRGCVANGGNINYYLNANNWAFKEDGTTASVLDGTDGTVRVDTTTKFYGKGFSNGNKRQVRISTIKIDDTWVEIPRMVIDAYRCTVDVTTVGTPKAVSVVNTTANFRGASGTRSERDTLDSIATDLGKPRTNISRATMRAYSVNAGSEMMCYEWYKWIFYWLPVIEYATFNMQQPFNANLTSEGYHQGGLGPGVTTMDSTHWSEFNGYYPLTPCGYANDLGNFSGTKQFDVAATATKPIQTMTIARYRGFDIFGDIWLNVDGIILQNDINSNDGNGNYILRNVYSTIDASKFADSITSDYKLIGSAITTEGYIKEFIIGNKAEIIPITIGGDTTKNKCDYTYSGSRTDTTLRTLLLGGYACYGATAGLGSFSSSAGVGAAAAFIGFRTLNKVVD